MSRWRRQLPVHSPLTAVSVGSVLARRDPRPELRELLRDLYGATQVLLTDSGTSALAIALRATAARSGGAPCALPAYGCFDLATAALAAGVGVTFYDIDPGSLSPRMDSLRTAVAGGSSSVVLVHHYGVPAPSSAARALAAEVGALVIEDAAQADGASRGGRPLGAGAAMTVLSFGRGKGLTAGHGGALLLNDEGSQALRELQGAPEFTEADPAPARAVVTLAAQWLLGRPTVYGIPARIPFLGLGETRFREPHEPSGLPRSNARVLEVSLTLAPPERAARLRNAERLRAFQGRTAPATLVMPELAGTDSGGWLRLPVLVPAGARPDPARAVALGIVRGYPQRCSDIPQIRANIARPFDAPGASDCVERLWTLPTHSMLTARDLVALESWLSELG